MQLTTLGFRSPGKRCFINCSSSWLCSGDEKLCNDQFQLQRSIPQDIAVVAGCALDLVAVAVAVAVAGCALEMKNFATTFLNSARHCISTNTKFYLQRV